MKRTRQYDFRNLMDRLTNPEWSVIMVGNTFHFVETCYLVYWKKNRHG